MSVNSLAAYKGAAIALTVSSVLGIAAWTFCEVFFRNNVSVYDENSILENVQAAVLFLAFLAYLWCARHRRDTLLYLSMALLWYAFFLREIDVERLPVPAILVLFGFGMGRNVTIAAGFTIIGCFALRRFTHYRTVALQFIVAAPGRMLLCGGALLLHALFFDKRYSLLHYAYFEETAELFGYCLFFLSAFMVAEDKPSGV